MRNRVLLWMFLLSIFIFGLPMAASAAVIDSGTYGDVYWTVDDSGVLTISGNGEMGRENVPPWQRHKLRIRTIRVEEGVTNTTSAAFSLMSNVTQLYLPSTLKVIESGSFSSCHGLTEIVIPEGVETIQSNAFHSCINVTSVKIADSVTWVGDSAFPYGASLQSIYIGANANVSSRAFLYCRKISQIQVSPANPYHKVDADGNLVSKDGKTFLLYLKSRVGPYVISDSITRIESSAFENAEGLTHVVVPASVTSMGEDVFHDCDQLASVDWNPSMTVIPKGAFSLCRKLSNFTIPDNITEIQNYAFYYCESMTGYTIPASVTTIGRGAFAYNYGVQELFVPPQVKSIGNDAFYEMNVSGYRDTVVHKRPVEHGGKLRIIEHTHEDVIDKGYPPTCVEWGLTDGTHCAICLLVTKKQETIHTTPHAYDISNKVEPTCTEDGYSGDKKCRDCGNEISGYVLGASHKWELKEVLKESSCTEEGVVLMECERCKETMEMLRDKKMHEWEWKNTPSTCKEEGVFTATCKGCGETVTMISPKVDHRWSRTVKRVLATCTTDGETQLGCEWCDAIQIYELPARGHFWTEFELETAGDCTQNEIYARTCNECGEKETQLGELGDHIWNVAAVTK